MCSPPRSAWALCYKLIEEKTGMLRPWQQVQCKIFTCEDSLPCWSWVVVGLCCFFYVVLWWTGSLSRLGVPGRLQQTPDTASAAGSGCRKEMEMDGKYKLQCSTCEIEGWFSGSIHSLTVTTVCESLKVLPLYPRPLFHIPRPWSKPCDCLSGSIVSVIFCQRILFFWGCLWFYLAVVQKVQNLQSCNGVPQRGKWKPWGRNTAWRSLLSADKGNWEAWARCSPVNLSIGIFSEQRLQGRYSQRVFI